MTSEDYKTVLATVRATMDNALRQNEKLIRGLEYYAGTDWRDLSMVDRGELARNILREVRG
jgi:hypothetical protein